MIEFSNRSRTRINEKALSRIASHVLESEGRGDESVSVAVVGEKRMKELNSTYRGASYAANVLSFPLLEKGMLGEVVLCPVRIRKDAGTYGITEREAQAWMLVHGLLHLLGYGHETDRDEEIMERKESAMLSPFLCPNDTPR